VHFTEVKQEGDQNRSGALDQLELDFSEIDHQSDEVFCNKQNQNEPKAAADRYVAASSQ